MRRLALPAALLVFAIGVTGASAELVGSADQIVSFDATISPSRLPRDRLVPIRIRAEGKIREAAKNRLAQLRSFEIAINRHGKLLMSGLPACHRQQLIATSPRAALASCQQALVGHGKVRARELWPEQKPFPIKGGLLAFNGRYKGSRVIFMHVHSRRPPATVIVPLYVRQISGTFGTTLSAHMPERVKSWAYLTYFRFVIGRRFTYRGEESGFVRASCPAPHGADEAILPFARVTFRFLTSKTLRTTLVRACYVRNEDQP